MPLKMKELPEGERPCKTGLSGGNRETGKGAFSG